MARQKKGSRRRVVRIVRLASLALMGSIVLRELQKPREERTWHGEVANVIPYDLRVPTVDRLMSRVWNPEGPVVSPKVFGVGWTVNAGRVVRMVQERLGA